MPASSASDFQDRFDEALVKLSEIFYRRGTRHALIGGIAVGLRSRPRVTLDADFIVSIPQLQLPSVLQDVHEAGFQPDPAELMTRWNSDHLAVMWFEDVRVDWLKPVLPLYQHILERSEHLEFAKHPFYVATAEGLILCKLVADRPQDRADIWQLLIAQQGLVDSDWIENEWQSVGSLDDPQMIEFRRMVASAQAEATKA
jgi:hypothetical protein